MRHLFKILAAFLWISLPVQAQEASQRISAQIRLLSDILCEGRATGSDGNAIAGMWIAQEYARIGLQPVDSSFFQGFVTAGGEHARNIVGMLPGTGKGTQRKYVVIGAHYDHIGTLGTTLYPGADSNASGVAALLNLAEMLHGKQEGCTHGVIFVAFDAKNHAMGGSKEMVRVLKGGTMRDPASGLPVSLKDIDFMVNIDQVGGTAEPLASGRKDFLMMLSDERTGKRQGLIAANGGHDGPGLDISFSYYGSKDFTHVFYRKAADQKAFLDAGIPSVMFTSGITRYNNKPMDTPEVIDIPILERRIELIYRYLIRFL